MATAYQKRMMLRKQSDLTRIADQYKQNIEAMTGQYESEFSAYQKQRDELMAPYEAAVKQYKEVQMPQYEAAAAGYRQRLDKFNQSLENFQEETVTPYYEIVGGTGSVFSLKNLATGKVGQVPASKLDDMQQNQGFEIRDGQIVKATKNKVPTFSEKAPAAPVAPTAPNIPAFDQNKFQQQRAELQTGYQREVGERKGARLAAVGRKSSRPLLKDA